MMAMTDKREVVLFCMVGLFYATGTAGVWNMGEPIVAYWAGPGFPGNPERLTMRAAKQLKDGGFNTVWAMSPQELDVAAAFGLRAIYDLRVGRKLPDSAEAREKLAARIAEVRNHPALYLYHHWDEPSAEMFDGLARMKAFFKEHDPMHPTWVNLLPTYANSKQLGIDGDQIRAYWEHVRLFGEVYRPELVSYDHYQFNIGGDTGQYFLNLGIVRQSAAAQNVPFMNGVQACSWVPGNLASPSSPRIPGPDEMAFLVYTTVAYGAQGIYYYVYSHPRHRGSIAELDGTTGDKYEALKTLNREFVAIAKEIRHVRFAGAYFQGRHAPGTTPYCPQAVLGISPDVPTTERKPGEDMANTILVTRFDAGGHPSHFMVVNLDYRQERTVSVSAPASLERFDPIAGTWRRIGRTADVHMGRGRGVLLRLGSPFDA